MKKENQMYHCFSCGSKKVVPQVTEHRSNFYGVDVVINVETMVCQDCKFQTFTDKQSDEYNRIGTEEYRKAMRPVNK